MKRIAGTLMVLTLIALGAFVAWSDAPVPVGQESKHHLKFENSKVRVYDVVVAPGESTLFHIHANDYAFVVFGGANLLAQKFGDQEQPLNLKDGDANYTPAPLIHKVHNIGSTTFHNLTIEFLGQPSGNSPLPKLPEGQLQTVVLENNRIRILRLILKPGQSTGMHTHSTPGLGIAVSEGDIQVEVPGKPMEVRHTTPGFFAWRDQPGTHSITNIGQKDYQSIDIEVR